MDSIVEKYFEKFCSTNNLQSSDKTSLFEKFSNYCVLSNHNIHNLDIMAVETGSGNDCSIDGLAIVINNRLIKDITELTDIISFRMDIKVKFIFIQSKTSEKFDGSEFLNFGSGVLDIFRPKESHKLKRNSQIQEKCEMIELIMDNFEILESPPTCLLYYVCNGKWIEDQNLVGQKDKVIEDLTYLDFLGESSFIPVGSKEIRTYYETSMYQNMAELSMEKRIELSYIDGVEQAFLVIMPAKELVTVISDGGNLKKGIFDSNIRDFQGYEDNRVNGDINLTLNSENQKDKFGFLNNGITIVGKSISRKRDKYLIKNFQIVNGCQTSNLLFENREKLTDKMWVSVKVIITEDEDFINKVVKATNSQTVVEEIHLQAMSEYQLHLESFYKTYSFSGEELYYERRLGQFNSDVSVEKRNIVSIEEQIKSFSALFLEVPHKSSRYYGSLLEDIEKKIFLSDHEPIIYYTSANISLKLENEFLNENILAVYKKFKYHILLLIKLLITKGMKVPPYNSKNMGSYCENILNEFNSDSNKYISKAIEILNIVVSDINNMEINKYQNTVNQLIMYCDLEVTSKDLKNYENLLEEMQSFTIPFRNISIDGDKRYNLGQWIDSLELVLFGVNKEELIDNIRTQKYSLNENDRESRKNTSRNILSLLNEEMSRMEDKINKSQRYLTV